MSEKKKLDKKTAIDWIILGLWVVVAIIVVWMAEDMNGWVPETEFGVLAQQVMANRKVVIWLSILSLTLLSQTMPLKIKVERLEKRVKELEQKEGE